MRSPRCLVPVTLLVLTAILPAQAILFVGAGGYPDLASAVAAASPGDTIEVSAGNHLNCAIDRGVTIRASASTATTLTSKLDTPSGSPIPIWNIPAGQTLQLVDMAVANVWVTGGRVAFDGCLIGRYGIYTTLKVQDATVHLVGSRIVTFWNNEPAIDAVNSDLTMVNGTLYSNSAIWTTGPGMRLDGSRLHMSQFILGHDYFPCLVLNNGSQAWLSDCDISMVGPQCPIEVVASTLETARISFNASTSGCVSGTPAPLVGINAPDQLKTGASYSLDFSSVPNDLIVVFASPRLGTFDWWPLLAQPSWLDDQLSFSVTVLATSANGMASASWPIPNNPSLIDLTMWWKGIGGFPNLPLQASPVAGGVVR